MMGIVKQDLLLHVENLHKRFDDHVVLAGVGLDVVRGSVFTVLGPSGAGKSVFLKCLADVMQPDAGQIIFDGRPLSSGDPAGARGVSPALQFSLSKQRALRFAVGFGECGAPA